MHYHFIAIGGAIMHNLAITLQKQGHHITGSDDEIYDPAKSMLAKAGILPELSGWFPEKITPDIDKVILGMHAKADNPELLKARQLGIDVQSFPEFIYENARNKKRIVVAGSHGKTTTTSMIMHVLKEKGLSFDYLVGARLKGFETMVQISDAPVIVIEGDEYLSSPIDRRSKFLHYHPHLSVITGIAWDHINVFPTFESYLQAFRQFIKSTEPGGTVFYFNGDKTLKTMVGELSGDFQTISYNALPFSIDSGRNEVIGPDEKHYPLHIFGEHNMQNLAAAWLVCSRIGIPSEDFFQAIGSFQGAAKRQQLLASSADFCCWMDFAHAPSKVKATTHAVKILFPERSLVASVELHTFSSLNKNFLSQYKGSLEKADTACIFYSPHTLKMKNMDPISEAEIKAAFGHPNIFVFTNPEDFSAFLRHRNWHRSNLLIMGSGTYGGLDLQTLAMELAGSSK